MSTYFVQIFSDLVITGDAQIRGQPVASHVVSREDLTASVTGNSSIFIFHANIIPQDETHVQNKIKEISDVNPCQ